MSGNLFDEMKPAEVKRDHESELQADPEHKSHVIWENIMSNGLPWVRVTCPVMHYVERKYTVSVKSVFTHCRVTEPIPADILAKYKAQKPAQKAGYKPGERWAVQFI